MLRCQKFLAIKYLWLMIIILIMMWPATLVAQTKRKPADKTQTTRSKSKTDATKSGDKADSSTKADEKAKSDEKDSNKNSPITFEQLITQFSSDSENERFSALSKMVELDAARSNEYIVRALSDRDWVVRGRAAQLIAYLPDSLRQPLQQRLIEIIPTEYWFVKGSGLLAIADILATSSQSSEFQQQAFNLAVEMRLDDEMLVRRAAVRVIAALHRNDAIDYIAPLLTDAHARVRWEAALALASLKDRRAVPKLLAARDLDSEQARPYSVALYLLGEENSFDQLVKAIDQFYDSDSILRRPLIIALYLSNDQRAREPLITLFERISKDAVIDQYTRLQIITALGKLHDQRVTPMLLGLVKNDDLEVRLSAISALKELANPAVVMPLIDQLINVRDRETGDALMDTIASFQRVETVDNLIAARKDKEGKVRPAIEILLGKMGISIDKLSQSIRSGENPAWQSPSSAARWLAALGISSSLEPLVAGLNHKNADVRMEAAKGLSALGDRTAIEPLLLLLEDPVAKVRSAAIDSLKVLGINGDSLGARLQSTEWRVRADAASLAGRMNLTELVPALLTTARDKEIDVRIESVTALAKLRDKRAVECLTVALDDETARVRASAANALGYIGDDRAAEALVRALASYDVALSGLAADALIRLNSPNSVNALIKTLSSRNWRARAQAARVLGTMQQNLAIQPLIKLLSDPAAPVRYYASEALTQFGNAAVMLLIETIKKEESGQYRYGPARTLALIGKPAVDPLCELLNDLSANLRITAATVLAEIGDTRAIVPLLNTLDDERYEVRQNVAMALGKMGKEAVPLLLDSLRAKKLPKRRAAAAMALKFIGDSESAPALLEALADKDDQVRATAAEALGIVGNAAMVAQLEELAKGDRIDTVRAAARSAINQIQKRKL